MWGAFASEVSEKKIPAHPGDRVKVDCLVVSCDEQYKLFMLFIVKCVDKCQCGNKNHLLVESKHSTSSLIQDKKKTVCKF